MLLTDNIIQIYQIAKKKVIIMSLKFYTLKNKTSNIYKPPNNISLKLVAQKELSPGGGVLPYMGHIGMCRCEGYGFQAVYSSIGYINQSFWV